MNHSSVTGRVYAGSPPVVRRVQQPEPPWSHACEAVWQDALARNPRLHDGPIWSVVSDDGAVLCVAPDRYKRLVVQGDDRVGDLGVRLLGIKGLIRDTSGRVLLARRGPMVRCYPGLWETAPAGGVNAGTDAADPLELCRTTLSTEAAAELGLCVDASLARVVAVIADHDARSIDLAMTLTLPTTSGHEFVMPTWRAEAWEYSEAVWHAPSDLPPGDLSPPARWLLSNAVGV